MTPQLPQQIWVVGHKDGVLAAHWYGVGARYYRALIAVLRITKMSFIPDIFTTNFAGLLFYFGLRIFEDRMVAEA
jgi:hypothetical protein